MTKRIEKEKFKIGATFEGAGQTWKIVGLARTTGGDVGIAAETPKGKRVIFDPEIIKQKLKENKMKINREEFLKELEAVLPGLSLHGIIEQSSCFVFKNKKVITYNDEIACQHSSCLAIEGAVPAMPLINILRKLKEEVLIAEIRSGELILEGKKRKVGIRIEKDILLPIDAMEVPKHWIKLPEEFGEAIAIVQECAGKDETQFIHLHPKWLEACDNYQVARFKIKTGVSKSTLIRRDSLKHIISLDMTKFSKTKNWIYFKNPTGLILSCRRWIEEFPDMSKILKTKGTPTTLPKGLKDAADRAEVFSAENVEDNQVAISLNRNRLKIKGTGTSGWYKETKKIKYNGQPLSFTISPKLLIELVKKHNKCQISVKRLKVDGGRFVYVTALGKVK